MFSPLRNHSQKPNCVRDKIIELVGEIANEKDYNDEFDDIIDDPEVIGSDFVIESITPLSYVEETA